MIVAVIPKLRRGLTISLNRVQIVFPKCEYQQDISLMRQSGYGAVTERGSVGRVP